VSAPATWTMPRDMGGYSDLEAAMLAAVWAAGLPEPVAEYPFARCCPHPKRDHKRRGEPECVSCDTWGAVSPMHEYRKGRAWRADFAWPEAKLIVECEGGIYSAGRHVRGKGYEADLDKYNHAALLGYRVLRFSRRQIESGEAVDVIAQIIGVEE